MANMTLAIDDALLERARLRAVTEGTSVNGVVREFLERYASARNSGEDLLALMESIADRNRPSRGGRQWTRDDLHDR